MTGLIVAGVIIGLIVIVGAATLFMLLPILIAAVGILVLVAVMAVAAVLLIPNFVTLDNFKPQILEALQKATGREIAIGGPIGFTVWPVLGLQLNDISIGNPEGAREPIMVSAKQVGVGVTLSSLMEHKLELRELKLVGAQINLSVAESGKGNWTFEPKAQEESASTIEAEPAAPEGSAQGEEFAIKDINIQSILIENADISYDRAGIMVAEVADIHFNFSMPSLDKAAAGEGRFDYRGQQVAFSGELANPRALSEAKASDIKLRFTVGGDKLDLTGSLDKADFSGQLSLAVASLPKLASWASGKPASLPVQSLTLNSNLKAGPNSASLTGLSAKLDDIAISGKAGVSYGGARPKITADLDVGQLDLNRFSTAAAPTDDAAAVAPSAAPDLSGLTAVNADITARLAGLLVKNLELGATTARVELNGGKLQASLSPASFYGGTVSAKADVNAGNNSFAGGATLDGVNIEPVLVALNGSSRLSGKGDFTVSVSGPVGTPEQIKAGLDGNGRFVFRDGAIKGVNIPALIRRAKTMLGAADTATQERPQQTDFTELTGSFTIADGLVSNQDLKMLSPLVRITGKGTFAIPSQAVNYRVDSALVADLTGQGGVLERKGLVVPINVSGTLGNLSYMPDVQGLVLGNIGSAKDLGATIQNLNTKEGQRATRNAVKDLLGIQRPADPVPAPTDSTATPEAAPAAPPPPPPAQPKPEDLLRNLLNNR